MSEPCSKLLVAGVVAAAPWAFIALGTVGCGSSGASTPDELGTGGRSGAGGLVGTGGASGGDARGSGGLGSGGLGSGGLGSGGRGSGGSGTTSAGGTGVTNASCNQPTSGATGACNGSYPSTSIASMRASQGSSCFELSHVGLAARTDSPTEPRIYVQDLSGSGANAILAKCAATASHACAPSVKARIATLYDTFTDGAQISIRGYYQYGSVTGFEEFYIEDIIDECKTVSRPAPITLEVSEVTRDARTPAKWFKRATIAIPAQDPWVMYDFSPPELLLGQPSCPDSAGFAMIRKSAGATAASGCSGMMNPPARTQPDSNEILIGRQFFNQFLHSADCNCSANTGQRMVTPTSSVSGQVLGYLILEQDKNSSAAYQVFEPAANQSFPIQ